MIENKKQKRLRLIDKNGEARRAIVLLHEKNLIDCDHALCLLDKIGIETNEEGYSVLYPSPIFQIERLLT